MDIQGGKVQTNQTDPDSDPNAFQRISTELKSTLFSMVSLLIKEKEVSVYVASLFALTEFFQVVGFAFHPRIHDVWGFPEFEDALNLFFEHFRFLPYFVDSNISAYLTIFYFLIGVILIVILGLAYIYYMSSRKRRTSNWPAQTIGLILKITSGVLFLPVFEYVTSIFVCSTKHNEALVHMIFSEVRCWHSAHLAEAILALFSSILFLIITSITTLIFFEARPTVTNFNARMDSRALLVFNLYKVILVLMFNFFIEKENQIAQIAILFIGSLIVFVKFQFENPFYNDTMIKIWSTLAALNLWTAIMLVFAKIMESHRYKEIIFVWLLMIPLVIFVNLISVDKRLNDFLINTNNFKSGNEVMNHISYLKKIINIQNLNKTAFTMLDGYLQVHRRDCFNEQCPCRNKGKAINNNRVTRNLLISDGKLSEKDVIIIYLIYQIYLKETKTFPSCTSLWISYSFFLLDKMGSKQQALQVLTEATQNRPALDHEFILYRYKKIIEDEISESQNDQQAENGLDIGSEASFQNHLRLCQTNIEKSALLHMEFWSQLSEDHPDLAKVGEIGTKINASVKAVEDEWSKLATLNPNNVKSMRLFGKFLIEIINNKERGEELLERANNLANVNYSKKNISIYANKDFSDEPTPLVVISGDHESFGIITNLNLAASSLFGFNKNELLNKKLNTLMAPLYAKYHDSFLESYLQTNESTIIGKNKERQAFGKTKSNYIFPFFYSVKVIPSMMQGVQFVSAFRVEKKFRNAAYIIAYADGTIDSISSSCISLLKVDKAILQVKSKIQDLIPNILAEKDLLFTSSTNSNKASGLINFKYPKDSEYLIDSDPPSVQLMCHLSDLIFHNGRENAGFQFKFEKPSDKTIFFTLSEPKISNFQFSMDRKKPVVYGEYVSGSDAFTSQDTQDYNEVLNGIASGMEGETHIPSSGSGLKLNVSTPKKKSVDNDFDIIKKIQYGIGIKTYKLLYGKVADIEEDEKSEENNENSQNENEALNLQKKGQDSSNINNNNNPDEEDLDYEGSTSGFSNSTKSRKVLSSVINDRTPPVNVRRLNFYVHLLAFVMIGLSTWDYVNFLNKIDDVNQNIEYIRESRTIVADLMTALSNVRDLYLFKIGLLDDLAEQNLRTNIRSALDAVKATKETLEKEKYKMSDEQLNLYDNPVVLLRNYQANSTMKGLIQATEDIITKGLNLADTSLSSITLNNPDYFFLTHNLFNDYYQSLLRSAELYVKKLFTLKDSSIWSFTLIFILSIVVLVASVFFLIPILLSVSRTEDQVLRLFLDIPDKIVKTLYSKCENFVSNLQLGEEDMSEFDQDEMDQENENEAQGWQTRKKIKRFKNTRKNHRSFLLCYLVISAIVQSPFLYAFLTSQRLLNNMADVLVEFNSTSYAESFYSFANNVQRQLWIDPNVPVLNQSISSVATNDIDLMRKLTSDILSSNSLHFDSHSSGYNEIFYETFYGNPCPQIIIAVNLDTCQSFANQTVSKGMSLALSRHFENMNLLLDTFFDLENNGTWPFSSEYVKNNIDSDPNKNQILNIMRVPRAKEISTMQDIYIKNTFRTLNANFVGNQSDDFESFKVSRLIVFTLFIALILMLYIFIWIPLISKFSNQIWKTKAMLNMIPIGVILKITSIRTYLRHVLNENHLHRY